MLDMGGPKSVLIVHIFKMVEPSSSSSSIVRSTVSVLKLKSVGIISVIEKLVEFSYLFIFRSVSKIVQINMSNQTLLSQFLCHPVRDAIARFQ